MSLKKTTAFLCALLLVLSCIPFVGVHSVGETDIELSASLSDNAQYIDFEISCDGDDIKAVSDKYGSDEVYLLGALPYQSFEDPNVNEPLTDSVSLGDGRHIRLALGSDNLYKSYVICAKKVETVILPPTGDELGGAETGVQYTEQVTTYVPLTERVYIKNISLGAKCTDPYPTYSSKKGLDIRLFTDAQMLGVSHTIINIPINEYISPSESDICVAIGGHDVYFNKNKLALLDHKVKIFSDSGINVIFNFVLTPPADSYDNTILSLYTDKRSDNASYYGFCCTDETGYTLLSASAALFTSRYTPDSGKGFVGSFIVGYEINSPSTYFTSTHADTDSFISDYADILQLFSAYAYSAYSNARVYISLNNRFNTDEGERDISGRIVIDKLNELFKKRGDSPWRICIDPYNVNISSALFSGETQSGDDAGAKYITMNNIGTLTKMLADPKYYTDSIPRYVLLGEVGYTSGSGSMSDQTLQAASYAYAYLKAECDELIDAMIYHSQVDSELEENDFGLYFNDTDTGEAADKKKIYEVFKYIDTEYAESVCSFALPVFGVQGWGELIYGCSIDKLYKRKIIEKTPIYPADITEELISTSIYEKDKISPYPSDNVYSIEYKNGAVHIVTYDTDPVEYRGIYHSLGGTGNCKYIRLKLSTHSEIYKNMSNVMIRLIGVDDEGKTVVYEGTSQINADTETELFFDISEFSDVAIAQYIKVWAKPFVNTNADDYEINITALDMCEVKNGNTALTVTLSIIMTALAALAVVFLVKFLTSLKRKKKKI